jgi:hypothetical protein
MPCNSFASELKKENRKMDNKTLIALIRKLNTGKTNELIFLRPLSKTVDFAKVWFEKPLHTDSIYTYPQPDNFYFIKNGNGFYVGAVYDANSDLLWFILPEFRKQGHLTKAMKEIIIAHLFQNRGQQRITINENKIGLKNFKLSEKVANSLGFKKVNIENGKAEYILVADDNIKKTDVSGTNTKITEERKETIRKQINFVARSLWLIQTELELKMGQDDNSDELKYFVEEIHKYIRRI